MTTLRATVLAALGLAALLGPAAFAEPDADARLEPAPIRPYAWLEEPTGWRQPLKGGLAVDTRNRAAVASFYNAYYVSALALPIGWTGSIAGCVAGTTSQAYLDATIQMVSYFRAMAGLPAVTNDLSFKPGAQDAALMMIAEKALSHSPGAGWACYTSAGAAAAGSSNLALGRAGPGAIDLYMKDPGSFNSSVGHRRWILYPPRAQMSTGSNDGVNGSYRGANALRVFGATTARPASPVAVTWPPAGFVPYPVVYPRWSLSLNSSPWADFAGATVTMTADGADVPLTVISRIDNGYGDNTIVWEPAGLAFGPGGDTTVDVTVADIGGSPSSVSYRVTIIDPALVPEQIFADGFESGGTSLWN